MDGGISAILRIMKISFRVHPFALLVLASISLTTRMTAQAVLGPVAGGIDLKGGSNFTISTQLADTDTARFLWLPDMGALRAGGFHNTPNPADIGQYSVALGFGNKASGLYSVALGAWSEAYGEDSFAAVGGTASGVQSVAFSGSASGDSSFAATGGFAAGIGSTALSGGTTEATADYSFAASAGYAAGIYSVALGGGAYREGAFAGPSSEAQGEYSVAIGLGTLAKAKYGTAFGTYNLSLKKNGEAVDPMTISADDPIFEIGTGTASNVRQNALTVFRDKIVRFGTSSGITFNPTAGTPSFTMGSATISASGGTLSTSGPVSVGGTITTAGAFTNTSGSFTGGTTGLVLNAGGTNQNITLTPSGTGNTILNGKVGIGSTSPKALLHVLTNSNNVGGSEVARFTGNIGDNPGEGPLLRFTNQYSTGTNPNAGEYNLAAIKAYDFNHGWGGALALQTASPAGGGGTLVDRLVIDPSGRVGIGLTNPYTKLDIKVTDADGMDPLRVSGEQNNIFFVLNSDQYVFYGTSQNADAGVPTRNSVFMTMRGNYWDGSQRRSADSALQTVVTGNNQYRFIIKTANTERMAIDQAGNVGIGTSSPDTLLTVAGDASVQGHTTMLGDASVAGVLLVNPAGDLAMGDFTSGPQPQ